MAGGCDVRTQPSGSRYQQLRSVIPLGHGVGQLYVRNNSNRYNFGCMTASELVFDARVSFWATVCKTVRPILSDRAKEFDIYGRSA